METTPRCSFVLRQQVIICELKLALVLQFKWDKCVFWGVAIYFAFVACSRQTAKKK